MGSCFADFWAFFVASIFFSSSSTQVLLQGGGYGVVNQQPFSEPQLSSLLYMVYTRVCMDSFFLDG